MDTLFSIATIATLIVMVWLARAHKWGENNIAARLGAALSVLLIAYLAMTEPASALGPAIFSMSLLGIAIALKRFHAQHR